jgi:hypothetical protein
LGPNVKVWKLVPEPKPPSFPPPPGPPATLVAGSFGAQLAVYWSPADGEAPLGYYVRYQREEELAPDSLPAPHPVPGNENMAIHIVRPGRYWVAVSAVDIGGEGPFRHFGPIEVGR